jgi:hypothetical protein
MVVKSSIFTLEKNSLHKFWMEFNQQFNGDVSIRILVLYDVVRRCTTSYNISKHPNSLKGCNWRVAKLDPVETLMGGLVNSIEADLFPDRQTERKKHTQKHIQALL